MFRKSPDGDVRVPESRPASSPKRGSGSRSILGPSLVFRGELSANEDLVIEGRIEGSIQHHNKNLTIGQRGRVKADINACVITVEGTVEGDLTGDEAVIIKGTAKVTGNAKSPRVVIEDGAQFTGQVQTISARKVGSIDLDENESPGLPKYQKKKAG